MHLTTRKEIVQKNKKPQGILKEPLLWLEGYFFWLDLQTLWVAFLIFLLPIVVTGILIRINNYLMESVVNVGGASMDNYKKKRRPVKESLAKDLAEMLDDNYSLGFYRVVAYLVQENFIFQTLSEVKDTHLSSK